MTTRRAAPRWLTSFLVDLKDVLAAFTAGLESYAPVAARFDDRHPDLALDHGLEVTRASLRWARRTIAVLRAIPAPPHSRPACQALTADLKLYKF